VLAREVEDEDEASSNFSNWQWFAKVLPAMHWAILMQRLQLEMQLPTSAST
jgi:hypothetical protein